VIQSTGGEVVTPSGTTFNVNCPFPTRVAGGGWLSRDTDVILRASAPLPGGLGWSVTIARTRVFGQLMAWVEAFAICTEQRIGYNVVTTNGSVGGLSNVFAEMPCPRPADFASGGGVAVGNPDLRPFGQQIVGQPAPERYGVWVRSLQPATASATFTVSAVCADFTQWPGREILLSPAFSVASGADKTMTLDCPVGKSVLHGAVMHATGELVTMESFPVNNGAAWEARVHHSGLSQTAGNVRLQVVCVRATR
jgi:hypothetical protein